MFIIFLLLCIENALMFPMLRGGLYQWPTKHRILLALHYTEIILYSNCSQIH